MCFVSRSPTSFPDQSIPISPSGALFQRVLADMGDDSVPPVAILSVAGLGGPRFLLSIGAWTQKDTSSPGYRRPLIYVS